MYIYAAEEGGEEEERGERRRGERQKTRRTEKKQQRQYRAKKGNKKTRKNTGVNKKSTRIHEQRVEEEERGTVRKSPGKERGRGTKGEWARRRRRRRKVGIGLGGGPHLSNPGPKHRCAGVANTCRGRRVGPPWTPGPLEPGSSCP